AGIAKDVGAAVALDGDAVEPQEWATIETPGIHAVLERAQATRGEQGADPCGPRTRQRLAHVGRHLPRRTFGGLERHIARETLHDHHIGHALADLVALDETAIVDLQIGLLEPGVRLAHLLDTLDLLHADVEEPNARALDVKQRPRHRRAHQGV